MTRPDDNDDGDLRDAHLLAALRHAPDREAAPPPALSALILARARAAAAPRGSLWQRAFDALRRPHVAGAFATLAVATLVGVMWSAHEPPAPEVARPLPAPAQKAEAEKKAPATNADASGAATAIPAPPAPSAAASPAPFVDAHPSAPAGVFAPAAPAESRHDAARKSAPAPARTGPRTKPSLGEPKEADVARPVPPQPEQRSAAPMAPAPALESAALPAPLPPAPADEATRERRTLPDAKPSAPGRMGSSSSMPMSSPNANLTARQEGAAETAALAKQMRGVDGPLPRMELLLGGTGADTSWSSARGSVSPQAQAPRDWWTRVREATRGRWVRAERAPPAAAPWLVLMQGDRRVATLWIEPGALVLSDDTRVWRAALDEAVLREWQESIARW